MLALAAVCASWEKGRKNKAPRTGKDDASDIRAYHFEVTEEATVYKVKLWPKIPIIKRVSTPAGVYQQNESSTFFYDVRRSDFKVVGVSAIL